MRFGYDSRREILHGVSFSIPPGGTLAVVGHNPTMSRLALLLDDALGDATARADLMIGLPTCAAAVFELDRDWADVQAGSATLVAFSAPRG